MWTRHVYLTERRRFAHVAVVVFSIAFVQGCKCLQRHLSNIDSFTRSKHSWRHEILNMFKFLCDKKKRITAVKTLRMFGTVWDEHSWVWDETFNQMITK